MFILSANGASVVDATGVTINPINEQRGIDEATGQPIIVTVAFEIVGWGFGYSVQLAVYGMEQQARDIFNDILANIKKNTDFYDVREHERKFVERWG